MDKKKKQPKVESSDSDEDVPGIYSSKLTKGAKAQLPPPDISEMSSRTSQNFLSNLAKERGCS
jgi:hypothetical protein